MRITYSNSFIVILFFGSFFCSIGIFRFFSLSGNSRMHSLRRGTACGGGLRPLYFRLRHGEATFFYISFTDNIPHVPIDLFSIHEKSEDVFQEPPSSKQPAASSQQQPATIVSYSSTRFAHNDVYTHRDSPWIVHSNQNQQRERETIKKKQ